MKLFLFRSAQLIMKKISVKVAVNIFFPFCIFFSVLQFFVSFARTCYADLLPVAFLVRASLEITDFLCREGRVKKPLLWSSMKSPCPKMFVVK